MFQQQSRLLLKKVDWYISIYKKIMLQTPLSMQFIGLTNRKISITIYLATPVELLTLTVNSGFCLSASELVAA
jgi:hypothetical protein